MTEQREEVFLVFMYTCDLLLGNGDRDYHGLSGCRANTRLLCVCVWDLDVCLQSEVVESCCGNNKFREQL